MKYLRKSAGPAYELDEADLVDAADDGLDEFNEDSASPFDLRAITAAVYRNRLAIALIMGVALLAGIASILLMPRIYQASASIQIDQQAAKVLGTEDVEPMVTGPEADRFLQTQVDVLTSRTMARQVANSLGLGKSGAFLEAMGSRTLADLTPREREELLLDTLQKNLTIDLRRTSRVVGINFKSRDPQLAARVANAYANEFIAANIRRKFSTSDYSRGFLKNELESSKRRLEASERELIGYARSSRLIDASAGAQVVGGAEGPRSLVTANLVQLNKAYADAKATRLQAQQRWEQARGVPATSLPEVLANQAMQQLLEKRAELDSDVNRMRQHMREDHPTVQQAVAQRDELDRQARTLAESIRNSIRNQYQVAQSQETAIEQQVAGLKVATLDEQDLGVRYNILKREVDTNRQMYESLLQRYKELSAEAGVTNNNISIVDAAEIPRQPASPRPLLNMALALGVGMLLAALFAYGREKLDDAIHDPRDVEAKLGLPLLGVVPQFGEGGLVAALDDPKSELAEAYHSVRSSLELSSPRGLPNSILVTSSNKGEGKSTTSYVLARNLGQMGRKVLLIDADLRRPSLHRFFELPLETIGLSNVLARMVPVEEVVRSGVMENLSLLPSGPLPPDPATLMTSSGLHDLLAGLVDAYDVIVVDGPPVMALADAAQITAAVDATIVVVEADTAHFGRARSAVSRLRRARGKLIGSVVTKYNPRKAGFTEGYDYYTYNYGKD